MNPEDQNLAPQNQLPGQQSAVPTGGSSWQQQALAAAQAAAQTAPVAQPAAPAPIPGVPAWQQEFRHQPVPSVDQGVPDMLAAADPQQARPQAPAPPAPQAQPAPMPPLPSAPPPGMTAGPVVSGAFGEDVSAAPVMGTGGPSPARKLIIIAVIVVVVAALAAGAYFFLLKGRFGSVNKAAEESKSTSSAIDAGKLSGVQLVLNDQTGLTKDTSISTATLTALNLDSNKQCSITYGTATSSELPGATIDAIVNHQIDLIKGFNAAVSGPTPGDALVLQGWVDKSKYYKLATLNFKLTKDQNRISSHYSIAITGDGTRLIVTRACYTTDGKDIPDSALAPLEVIAKKIMIAPGT